MEQTRGQCSGDAGTSRELLAFCRLRHCRGNAWPVADLVSQGQEEARWTFMPSDSWEPWEDKRLRFLELAAEAIRSAAQSRTPFKRNGYIDIAHAWLELADGPDPRNGDGGSPVHDIFWEQAPGCDD